MEGKSTDTASMRPCDLNACAIGAEMLIQEALRPAARTAKLTTWQYRPRIGGLEVLGRNTLTTSYVSL